MEDDIRLGVLLPTGQAQWGEGTDPRRLTDFAVRAERLGYASVWTNDSLVTPRIEALVMLATAAAVTEGVTLGTATLMPVLRRPVQAAQSLASLDLMSGGRLTVAVGAGFPGRFGRPLHELSEVPWEGRFARLDDTVALWRHIWSNREPSSYRGPVLRFEELPAGIAPYRPGGPPIWLGGATPAALARTGRLYDGWLPYPPDPAGYGTGLAAVREAAAGAGRDPMALTAGLFATLLVTDDEEAGMRDLAEYTRAVYGMTPEEAQRIQLVAAGSPSSLADRLRPYVEAGARHIVCRIGVLDLRSQLEQLERIAELGKTLNALRPEYAA
ncbi:LLM class flavin-dependent oxidoreductase [Sphaerisporangium fuscum]|uniref:LLM class flavin-dependent oxidoreductase n=1 Tax=Sphaerisporangium fuscum TaxID=2835868 RepID=UPI001BDD4D22|nr:LLM class flavin-dependent oxidoreductase [Sphaerisporangium fuscum]